MTGASSYQRALAAGGIVLLTAGDFFRYLLTWYGWGALVLIGLTLTVRELVRMRVDPRRLPLPLLAFLLLAAVSIAWSAYPGASAAGVLLSLLATAFGLYLGAVLSLSELLGALSTASRLVIGGSLLFELAVALLIRRPILPLWVAYCDPARIRNACYWSRDLLLQGGRIQGAVGNANILAMAALVGVIVFAVRWAAREGSRRIGALWIALALLTLALTRSSTVLVAAAGVLIVAVFLLLVRRLRGPARTGAHLAGLGVLVVGVLGIVVARGALLGLLGKSPDLTNRTYIWGKVLQLISERPVAGWGWVSYWPNWEPFYRDLIVIKGIHYYQAHNAWLDLLLQLGVIGFAVFAAYILVVLVRAWRGALTADAASGIRWPLAAAAPLLLVALIVQSLTESRLLIEIGFALPVAIAVAMRPSSPARPTRRRVREPSG